MSSENSEGGLNISTGAEILTVRGLSVILQGKAILDNLNFSVKKGSIVAIVGPNGAGKTTLFRALLNLVPYTGDITWRGRKRIGYVPQSPLNTDLPVTVEEFLKLRGGGDVSRSLLIVGLGKEMLKTQIGQLSGGQLQRVLLAWSIVDEPDILLFDEPTSGVDIGSEEPIYERILELKRKLGTTILLISHNHHVVLHYTDYVLGLNRRQVFYGETSKIDHDDIMGIMSGRNSDVSINVEHKHPAEGEGHVV